MSQNQIENRNMKLVLILGETQDHINTITSILIVCHDNCLKRKWSFVNQVHIPDEAVGIKLSTHTLGKVMNPSLFFHPALKAAHNIWIWRV